MSSLVITIKSGRAYADLARFIGEASNPRQGVQKLKQFLKSVESGAEPASIVVQRGSANPVAATGTLTLTYNSITNGDTCVIAGVTLTCVTGTPGTGEFKKETDATKVATNLVAAINANATLAALVVPSSALGVVTLTALQAGVCGNQYTIVGSAGMVASAAKMAGGAGGALTTAVTFSRGL
jgi:phage tail sheath gpL-like